MIESEILNGHFYVKKNDKWLIREVLDGSSIVNWQGYYDGNCSWGTGRCTRKHMAVWAEREATPEEISRLQIEEAKEQRENSPLNQMLDYLFDKISQLREENDQLKEQLENLNREKS